MRGGKIFPQRNDVQDDIDRYLGVNEVKRWRVRFVQDWVLQVGMIKGTVGSRNLGCNYDFKVTDHGIKTSYKGK